MIVGEDDRLHLPLLSIEQRTTYGLDLRWCFWFLPENMTWGPVIHWLLKYYFPS